jgi:hypothetical protein
VLPTGFGLEVTTSRRKPSDADIGQGPYLAQRNAFLNSRVRIELGRVCGSTSGLRLPQFKHDCRGDCVRSEEIPRFDRRWLSSAVACQPLKPEQHANDDGAAVPAPPREATQIEQTGHQIFAIQRETRARLSNDAPRGWGANLRGGP